MDNKHKKSVWHAEIIIDAIKGSFYKLNPITLVRNPVMLIVELGSVVVTYIAFTEMSAGKNFGFNIQISLWLWFTVLFANFAEALAEGKGKAQAEALKKSRSETSANKLLPNGAIENIPSILLRKGDIVVVIDNEIVPIDGEIIDGVSLIDESAITGESAPVVRESGGDKSGVTGGTGRSGSGRRCTARGRCPWSAAYKSRHG